MLSFISPGMHMSIVFLCACFALMSGLETTVSLFGATFEGQQGVFVGCLLKWFMACGLVEFVYSLGYGAYKLWKQ